MSIEPNPDFYQELLDNLRDGVYFVDHHRRITFWNKGAERLTGFLSPQMIGSRCSDDLLMHVTEDGISLCRSDCPLSATILDGKARDAQVFLHHRAGHRVPVLIRTGPIRNGYGEIVGAFEIFSDVTANTQASRIAELEKMTYLDSLTQTGNRRFAEVNLKSRLEDLRDHQIPLGLLFADIDRFKWINDNLGHQIGDEVLKMVAQTIANAVRSSFDLVCRWGGEEFTVLLLNVDRSHLALIGEKLRYLVEQSGIRQDSRFVSTTISLGGTMAQPDDSAETLVERADRLMYRSKTNGRNRVTLD